MNNIDAVITGMGCLCAAGTDLESVWRSMAAGIGRPNLAVGLEAGIKRLSPVFEVPWTKNLADKLNLNFEGPPTVARTRCVDFFLHALDEALTQAGLTTESLRGKRVGVAVGTTVGCTLNNESFYRDFKNGLNPELDAIHRFLSNNPAPYLSEALHLRGPVSTINNACTSGVDAVGQGMEWINDGLCDIVIAGGTDELSRIPYLGFSSLMNTSESPCKPFDVQRDGLNLGEGAGLLILESKSAALKRGAQILLEVAGYGTSTDAHHPTAPHPQGIGLEAAIRRALGELNPQVIRFINAHGTATPANDKVEGSTFARIFGSNIPVFGTKGYTGHTLGAAGAVEAVFTGQGLITGKIPPTAGFETPDPECLIIPTQAVTDVSGHYALSTSLAFGGNNSALVLKVYHD